MTGKRRPEGERGVTEKRGRREVRAELCGGLKPGTQAARKAWERREPGEYGCLVLDCTPFPHGVVRPFLENSEFLEELREELLALNFHPKSNDLYKFKQSQDLKKRKEPHIKALRQLLYEDFRQWLSDITGVELESTVDISCAQYNYTDVLLCHDDELEGRRFAFILYLVPEWAEQDGGSLDLYNTDERVQPGSIVKSLVPSWNTLAFFEVSPVSFHQVSEVLNEEKCRLSVSGWFHGPSLDRPPRCLDPVPIRSPHIPHDHEILYEWINPVYLSMESQAQIQEEFEERSEMLLKNFLKRDKFQAVSDALKEQSITWELLGPPNRRCYERAGEALPDVLDRCMELLKSEAFFLLLSNLSGLKLHFLAADAQESDEEEGPTEQSPAANAKGGPSSRHEQSEEEGPSGHDTTASDKGRPTSRHGQSKEERPTEHGHATATHGDPDAPSEDGPALAVQGDITGIESSDLAEQVGEHTPTCSGELRHWTHGHYTMIHDHDPERHEFALDLLLFCGCEDWKAEYGGFTSYIAKGEDEELLTVNPEDNCLALVYRDKETMRFVKHVNHKSLQRDASHPNRKGFWDFAFIYYE
ncbi:prolyl 3-hydroxylase OGFOD1 [Discoglossus pictus]